VQRHRPETSLAHRLHGAAYAQDVRQRVLGGLLLWPVAAAAHVVPFDFIAPSGAGERTVDDAAGVQWSASDPMDIADFTLWAVRGTAAPFVEPPKDVAVMSGARAVNDPLQVYSWDTHGVTPGCYQPFAEVHDPIEGRSLRLAAGIIGVGPSDGGNQPVVLWLGGSGVHRADADGGFTLQFQVLDPDDDPQLIVRYLTATLDGGGTLATGLRADSGTFVVDTHQLLPAAGWYLQIEAQTPSSTCAAWFQGELLPPLPNGDDDAGVADAGPPTADAGQPDAGTAPAPRASCGCANAGGSVAIWLAALGLMRRRLRAW
jgi:hypothetical protein